MQGKKKIYITTKSYSEKLIFNGIQNFYTDLGSQELNKLISGRDYCMGKIWKLSLKKNKIFFFCY